MVYGLKEIRYNSKNTIQSAQINFEQELVIEMLFVARGFVAVVIAVLFV